MPSILPNRFAIALTLVLLLEGGLYYSAHGLERVPSNRPLSLFPIDVRDWHMVQEQAVEPEVQEVLRADDTMTRVYLSPQQPGGATLFVAYFKTQRTGQAPHSPKNCLPGSGWEPIQEGLLDVSVAGEPRPITINRYLVAHGDNVRVVLYWYQSRRRVVASDYAAKFWLIADSMRYHRSDTAIVRIEVPVTGGDDARATRTGVDFIQALFPVLQSYLPA